MKKQTYILASLAMFQKVLSLGCFLMAAGTLSSPKGWLYFLPYLLITAFTLTLLLNRNPNALSLPEKNTPKGKGPDIILRNICSPLAFYVIYIAAGLDTRFQLDYKLPWLIVIGLLLSFLTNLLMSWTLLCNKYYESDFPTFKEANPLVCTKGPYAFIRHPGYAFMALWAFSLGLAFGYITTIIATIIIILLIARIYFEDKALYQNLTGYEEYTQNVSYRMIPFIW